MDHNIFKYVFSARLQEFALYDLVNSYNIVFNN